MKKKMVQIGKKTGLEVKEVNNLIKIGASGLLALALSLFTAAWSNVSADEPETQPKANNDKKLQEKCKMVPEKKSTCKKKNTTYYYDSEKNECIAVTGCVSTVFDKDTDCIFTCYPKIPAFDPPSSTSKYGVIERKNFKNEK